MNSTPSKGKVKGQTSPNYDSDIKPILHKRSASPSLFTSRDHPGDHYSGYYSSANTFKPNGSSNGLPITLPGSINNPSSEYISNFVDHYTLNSKKSPYEVDSLASTTSSQWPMNIPFYNSSSATSSSYSSHIHSIMMNYGRNSGPCKHGLSCCSTCTPSYNPYSPNYSSVNSTS